MIRTRRPGQSEIDAHLASLDTTLRYPETGATADARLRELEAGTRYDVDHYGFSLGRGRERLERARAALLAWRHFEIPWLTLEGRTRAAQPGDVVATLVRVAGLWLLNPCRVVYVEPAVGPDDPTAFAYGTLQGHVECGEERFTVSFDPTTEEIRYEIVAFSRPAGALARLGYPIARRYQRRFAHASALALRTAVSDPG